MSDGIGGFVREKREELGIAQGELARRVEVSKGYLSTLEANKIGLPAPDVRRRLAKALGVSHLQLLVAAGEITEAELGTSTGVVERDPDDPREQLIARIRALPWDRGVERGLTIALDVLEEKD